MFFRIIFLCLFATSTKGSSTGAPDAACTQMTPLHGALPQTDDLPATLSLSTDTYKEDSSIEFTIKPNSGVRFMGILAQMRKANSSAYELEGSFETGNFFRTACANQNNAALTHTRRLNDLTELKFTWKAPSSNKGSLQLWYTLVLNKTVFWIQQKSKEITYDPLTTQPPPQDEINLSECGKSKSCYRVPRNCIKESDCDYVLTWQPENNESIINFEISARVSSEKSWTAVAFSKDLNMGDDSVIDCFENTTNSDFVQVQASWNEGRTNQVLNDKFMGLVKDSISGVKVNDRLRCRFQRYTVVPKSDTNMIYDLNVEYYVFLGKGNVNSLGEKEQHRVIPEKSSTKLLMTEIRNETDINPTTDPSEAIDTRGCGSQKGCYRDPEGCEENVCTYLLTWKPNSDKTKIEFEISANDNNLKTDWTSVAFSNDQSMGDDSVIDCSYNSDEVSVSVQSSWNLKAKSNEVLRNKLLGLESNTLSGSKANGRLRCRFTRSVAVSGDPEADRVFDLSKEYYIFLGKGPSVRGVKSQHELIPAISPKKLLLTEISDISGLAKFPLVKTHGILMMIAWAFFANIGLILPRYFKLCWNRYQLFQQKIWFQIHRLCMITVVLCTIAGFIVIFIEVKGFSKGTKPVVHAALGVASTGLCILNPIMAVFRPPPQHPRRPIFNWLHFFAGETAHILTVPMVYLAFQFGKVNAPSWLKWVYTAIVTLHIFVEMLLLIFKHVKIPTSTVAPANEKDSSNRDVVLEETKPDNVPTAILLTYFFILLALITTIVIHLAKV